MGRGSWLTMTVVLALSAADLWASEKPTFAEAPSVARDGEGATVTFALAAPGDVTVAVEDAGGRIVRHLASGVLGDNAPPPFRKGALKQTLAWDGADDLGARVPKGYYRVRVSTGLRPTWAGTAFSDESGPDNLDNVMGLAAAADGRVYVLSRRWMRYVWFASGIQVFLRDGLYERSIKPFPATIAADRVKALGAFVDGNGHLTPAIHQAMNMSVYPYEDVPHQTMAVTPDGRIVFAVADWHWSDAQKGRRPRLATIDRDGGVSYDAYAGDVLHKDFPIRNPYLAVGADGKTVYLTGLRKRRKVVPAVFKTRLPERGAADVFFGDPGTPGADNTHCNFPKGLAADGNGHLLVSDFANNRVVVLSEKDGTMAGSFAVPAPGWIGVSARSGRIYVHSGDEVIKFTGWRDAKEMYRLALPRTDNLEGQGTAVAWFFALDDSDTPPYLWIGRGTRSRTRVKDPLLRSEDLGHKFGRILPPTYHASPYLWNVTVDPTRRDVACKVGSGHRRGNDIALAIMNEATGKTHFMRGHDEAEGGQTYRLGPDGLVYALDNWGNHGIRRFDRNGRLAPFEHHATDKASVGQGRIPDFTASGTTFWERDFYVDRRGDIYAKSRAKVYHGYMTVDVFGADGRRKRTVAVTCDGALGPRVDPRGNLYMAECIRPTGVLYPPGLAGRVPKAAQGEYTWIYGSIVKYGPRGGAVWYPGAESRTRKYFAAKPVIDPTLVRETVTASLGSSRFNPRAPGAAVLQGAAWWRYGVAFLADMHGGGGHTSCHCTGNDFDVDDFGRTFYPDQGRFRVAVLDTAGNRITTIGAYGNQDSWGPAGYVRDATGFFRRRLPTDPADLESPFARPAIGIGWMIGVAVSDRYVYVADAVNRRILRVRLNYATEAVCAIE